MCLIYGHRPDRDTLFLLERPRPPLFFRCSKSEHRHCFLVFCSDYEHSALQSLIVSLVIYTPSPTPTPTEIPGSPSPVIYQSPFWKDPGGLKNGTGVRETPAPLKGVYMSIRLWTQDAGALGSTDLLSAGLITRKGGQLLTRMDPNWKKTQRKKNPNPQTPYIMSAWIITISP